MLLQRTWHSAQGKNSKQTSPQLSNCDCVPHNQSFCILASLFGIVSFYHVDMVKYMNEYIKTQREQFQAHSNGQNIIEGIS